MSREMKYMCDVCRRIKGEANHWLLMRAVWRPVAGLPDGMPFFGVAHWLDVAACEPGTVHLCGDACMQRMLASFLEEARAGSEKGCAAAAVEALPKDDRSYAPIECEFCGPRCFHGAEHNQRVGNSDRYSDGGEL